MGLKTGFDAVKLPSVVAPMNDELSEASSVKSFKLRLARTSLPPVIVHTANEEIVYEPPRVNSMLPDVVPDDELQMVETSETLVVAELVKVAKSVTPLV